MHVLNLGGAEMTVVVVAGRLFVGETLIRRLREGEELDSVLKLTPQTVRCRLRCGRRETLLYVSPQTGRVRIEETDFSSRCSRQCRPPIFKQADAGDRVIGHSDRFYGLPRRRLARA